jgi:2-dehydropantoate 2-reductase
MTRIAVIGIGAVGGIVAWHLARAGVAPTLVARPEAAEALNRSGLTLRGGGVEDAVPVTASALPSAAGPQDVVFACLKAHHWPAALETVLPLLGPDTILVSVQNGIPWWFFHGMGGPHDGHPIAAVDAEGTLTAQLPSDRILGCAAYVAATRETATQIRWNGRKRFVLGDPRGGITKRLERVTALLAGAGLAAEATPDIRREVWAKLLGNVTFNPLSVAAGATMGRMGSHEPLQRILRRIIEEAIAVAHGLGIACAVDIEERLRVEPVMAEFKTSMLQDYEAGRPLELAAIVEAVIELGRLADVPTPTIETIAALAAERAAGRAR